MGNFSRRKFLKSTALSALSVSALGAIEIPETQPITLTYFIQDTQVGINSPFQADKTLYINGDISDIYAELKQAFSEGAFVGSVSSATTFFVLSTMAKDYGMRVAYKTKFDNAYAWILAPKGVRI